MPCVRNLLLKILIAVHYYLTTFTIRLITMQKSTSFYRSLFGLKCPHCRQGDLFVKPGLFRFKQVLEMPERCSRCNQIYLIEPGFWIGALWASYPILVLIEVPFLISAIYWHGDKVWLIFITMLFAFLLFFPLMLRLGRSIWIHLFVRYDAEAIKKASNV